MEKIGDALKKFELKNEEETILWGENFVKKLSIGELILVSGDLGAGKTSLAKGIGKSLKLKSKVTSPTFTKLNIHHGKWTFYHFDLYNIKEAQELEEIGIYDFLEPDDGISLVEWWEKFPKTFIAPYHFIKIEKKENFRVLSYNYVTE